MKRSTIVPLLLVLVAGIIGQAAGAEPKIRILLTYGGHGFEQGPFFAMFAALPGIQFTKAEFPKDLGLVKPGLQQQYDALVMYDMNPKITPEQQKAFVALLQQGIGVVSLHHNLGAHRDWPEYRKIIGGQFVLAPCEIDGRKYPKSTWSHDEKIRVTIADRQHPITQGIADFTIPDETYGGLYVSPNVHLLLTTDHPKNSRQLGWVTHYGNSKVVCLMLGHDAKAYADPNYRQLVLRSIRFVTSKP